MCVCVWELVDPTVFNSPVYKLTHSSDSCRKGRASGIQWSLGALAIRRTERVGEIGWLEGTKACERGEAVGSVCGGLVSPWSTGWTRMTRVSMMGHIRVPTSSSLDVLTGLSPSQLRIGCVCVLPTF